MRNSPRRKPSFYGACECGPQGRGFAIWPGATRVGADQESLRAAAENRGGEQECQQRQSVEDRLADANGQSAAASIRAWSVLRSLMLCTARMQGLVHDSEASLRAAGYQFVDKNDEDAAATNGLPAEVRKDIAKLYRNLGGMLDLDDFAAGD